MVGKQVRAAVAGIVAAAIVVAAAPDRPSAAADAIPPRTATLGRLQISGPYVGRQQPCSGWTCPGPEALTRDGSVGVDVGCVLFWCLGTVRLTTVDPADPGRTIAISGFGFGVLPQVCWETLQGGYKITIPMRTLVQSNVGPFITVAAAWVEVWVGGTNAGQFTLGATAPTVPSGGATPGWTAFGTIDPARINVQTIPFDLPATCY